MKIFKCIAIVFISLIALSCSKKDGFISNEILGSKSLEQIPYYNNIYEVFARIDSINNIDSLADRITFEKKTGYESIGLISDLFVDSVEFDSCFDEEDFVLAFYDNYSGLIDTIWEDGELYLDPKYNDNYFRNVANVNGLFRVGDTVVRIFKRKSIATHIDQLNELIDLDENNDELPGENYFYFCKNVCQSMEIPNVPIYHYCNSNLGLYRPAGHTPNNSRGDRRVKLASEWLFDIPYNGNPTCNNYSFYITFKAYKKTRVCFIPIKSNISYQYAFDFHCFTPYYQWIEINRKAGWHTEYKHKITKTIFRDNCCDILGFPGVHLSSIYIQTYAPSSGVLTIEL